MTSLRNDIIAHIPADLKRNPTCVIGAFRDATRKVAHDGGKAAILEAVENAIGWTPNIFSKKGALRVRDKMLRAFGDKLVSFSCTRHGDGFHAMCFTVTSINAEDLRIFEVILSGFPRVPIRFEIDEIGRVTKHAVARLVERGGMQSVSLRDIMQAAQTTLRFVKVMHTHGNMFHQCIPVPDPAGKLVAIIDVRSNQLVTFTVAEESGARRRDWVARFMSLDNKVRDEGAAPENYAPEYLALLNEGGRIWAETREPDHRMAA